MTPCFRLAPAMLAATIVAVLAAGANAASTGGRSELPLPPRHGAAGSLSSTSSSLAAGNLGLFIHYGPSTLLDTSDGAAWVSGIWSTSYPALVGTFHPNAAAAASWVALAERIGANYIVFTAKHHDGYALWPTNVHFDRSAGASRYQWEVSPDEDVLGALVRAARAAGMPLYVYYSLPDWYEHSYRVSDPVRFLPLVKAQLHELLTDYGPFAGVWLDGAFDRPLSFWHLPDLEAEIHELQPRTEIGVNRHPSGIDAGEGFQIYESTLPSVAATMPTQVTYPIGKWWFYSETDKPRSHASLLSLEHRANRLGASLLLDVPPRGDGSIDPAYVKALVGAAAPAAVRHTRARRR